MIVDLHAHYPMHLPATARMADHGKHDDVGDFVRGVMLDAANRLANYPENNKPVVTIDNLRAGGVGVALSVLYAPFDEIDIPKKWDAPPLPHYFEDLLAIMDAVEASVQGRNDVVIARNPAEMDAGIAQGKLVLIHAVEGGFHLGSTDEELIRNIGILKGRGVGYITVAHLLYRQIATNAPAIPKMTDEAYHKLFRQPAFGLTDLGRTLIRAMVDAGILIDITHMSDYAIDETVALLESMPAAAATPIIATHAACNRTGPPEYNITGKHIRDVQKRDGVIGLIACSYWMSVGAVEPTNFAESMNLLSEHIHIILNETGSTGFAAIGSDMDGFIKPPLAGIGSPLDFPNLESSLTVSHGDAVARQICSGNALRVLRKYWKGKA